MTDQTPWHVVLIDDEEDIREVMSIALRDEGYRVETAPDGIRGIEICQTNSPQIVITDIRMPGMNGIQVLEAVKKIDPNIEVIVFTAFAEMDLAIQALQLDASDFITKPINDDALHLALNRAKQRYTSRKQLQDYARLLEREVTDQAQILHQDKMMSLGRLAASVVHEINNPLAGILNYSRLMIRILRKGALSEERREKFIQYLTLVENETARCSQIVSSLLAFSRKSEPAFEVLNINDLVERCVSLSRHKLELQHIHLHIAIQNNLPPLKGDFNQLQQCLINIIFNAMDAMPQGGELYIDGYLNDDGSAVSISVKDSGTGISKEDLPYIFEPFYTTKQEGFGVGLGLSTVFGIIERHHGTIDVDSKESGGTTFTIQLPV